MPEQKNPFGNDPFGEHRPDEQALPPNADTVSRFHINSDTDSSIHSKHHTLGNNRNQASKGDHRHDGENGRKIGEGMNLSVSGSKGANAALTSLLSMLAQVIEFTDTTT